jgi:uncharacterized protein with PQ loop repeat
MFQIQSPTRIISRAATLVRWLVGAMSVVTMLMTIPQVAIIWVGHQAAGVCPDLVHLSILCLLWLWFGIQKRDKIFICRASAGSC